jgi:hypothetical protein
MLFANANIPNIELLICRSVLIERAEYGNNPLEMLIVIIVINSRE